MTGTKLIEIFPTKPCTRCGGCGRYSYNQMDGDRCYGCSGSGLMWATKKVDAAVAAYHEMVKKAKHPLVSDLVVGDKVLNDMADRANGQTWQTVTDIVITDKACGWSVKGDVKTAWAFRTIVTLSDGSTHDVASNQIVRRHCGRIDITPFLEMAGI